MEQSMGLKATEQVRSWMLRSELGRSEGRDERLEEIVAEFEGVDEDAELYADFYADLMEGQVQVEGMFKKSAVETPQTLLI